MPRPGRRASISLRAVVLPAPAAPRSTVIRPARASKETSSTAGGRALREVLVSPKAWITCSKIACDVRFWCMGRFGDACHAPAPVPVHRSTQRGPCSLGPRPGSAACRSDLGAQHRRVEQRGTTGPEELGRAAALACGRASRRDEEPGGPGDLAVEVARVESHPHTASYTRRSSPTVNSGGQNAVASEEYSILERARSTPSARIWAWSKASGATGSPSRP